MRLQVRGSSSSSFVGRVIESISLSFSLARAVYRDWLEADPVYSHTPLILPVLAATAILIR